MATATIMFSPWFTGTDDDNNPLPGGLLKIYDAGTSDPATVWEDADRAATHAFPIVLDGAGRAVVFLDPTKSYKVRLENAAGVLQKEVDLLAAVPLNAAATLSLGTAGETIAAGNCLYMSDGSGALVAGRWYKARSNNDYSSTLPTIGFAVAAAANAGDPLSICIQGEQALAGPLTVGATYYISATTAGEIVAAEPATFPRRVGQAPTTQRLVVTANPPTFTEASATALIDEVVDPKIKSICNARLTLTSGVPVTTADVLAATNVFLTPFAGNNIGLYIGGAWVERSFSELTEAVPAAANTGYDVFAFDNAGVVDLELAAWNSLAQRHAAGAYATLLPTQDGVYVKSTDGTAIDATRRYVGSFRTTSVAGQTEDSVANRFLSNYYHRFDRPLRRIEPTNSWAYSTATIRQANGAAANKVSVFVGVAGALLRARVAVHASNDGGNIGVRVGFGEDSTSTFMTQNVGGGGQTQGTVSAINFFSAQIEHYPAVGSHDYSWNEVAVASGNTTWYSNLGQAFDFDSSGIDGFIEG